MFVDFLATSAASKPSMETITVALLADYMLACTASKEEDGGFVLHNDTFSIKSFSSSLHILVPLGRC